MKIKRKKGENENIKKQQQYLLPNFAQRPMERGDAVDGFKISQQVRNSFRTFRYKLIYFLCNYFLDFAFRHPIQFRIEFRGKSCKIRPNLLLLQYQR